MRACVMALVVCLGVSSVASAHQLQRAGGSTAIVVADAPIFLVADATRQPLRVAAKGTTLVIDKDNGDWIQVTFNDPQYGLRQGFIQAKFVQREALVPTDLSVPGTKTSSPAPAVERIADRRAPQEQRPVPAQPSGTPGRTPLQRKGFWFSAGLGFGTLTCDGCEGDYIGGFSGGLAAGGTLNPHVLMGVGTTGWSRSEGIETLTAGTFDLRFRIYPSLYHGFFVNAGVGLGSITDKFGSLSETQTGLGIMYGVGWDIRTGRNISVTPFWNGSGIAVDAGTFGFGQIGVGFTVH